MSLTTFWIPIFATQGLITESTLLRDKDSWQWGYHLLLSVLNGWLKRDMLIIAGKRLASSLEKKSKNRIFYCVVGYCFTIGLGTTQVSTNRFPEKSTCSSRTLPSCRTDVWDCGLVTTVGVSSKYKVNNEIVGWIPQLCSRYFNTNFVRMIDNSNKYLLNQIMRESTPKLMKFRICILTSFVYRAWLHSQIVWINLARVLVGTLPSESLV